MKAESPVLGLVGLVPSWPAALSPDPEYIFALRGVSPNQATRLRIDRRDRAVGCALPSFLLEEYTPTSSSIRRKI